MEWPPLREEVELVSDYDSILEACKARARKAGGERVVILVKDVDELVRVEELPWECIMLIKPESNTNGKSG